MFPQAWSGSFALCLAMLQVAEAAPVTTPPRSGAAPFPDHSPTFATPIASILYRHCTPCHRPGQAAPFPLVTYADALKHAREIREMVELRRMPPWLPDAPADTFEGARILPDGDREPLLNWLSSGLPEGPPAQTPSPPEFPSDVALGNPDLVIPMESAYVLGASGGDVYRNFVLRVDLPEDRWVRTLEFRPGNARVVHHAFVRLDESGQARRLDAADSEPGFGGMTPAARMPAGQFLVWNPGAPPVRSAPGLPWRLPRRADLVVEAHLNRTGKPEPLQCSIGLHFSQEPPTRISRIFKLASYDLHFPAGATSVVVRDSMVLPVEVELLSLSPHAHYLCRRMEGLAILPDGSRQTLIRIPRWDFNWQSAFTYTRPMRLPAGSTLLLEYHYDNSTNNPANPNHPPRRVTHGAQSTDEMCELGFQVVLRDTNDAQRLDQAAATHRNDLLRTAYRARVASDPRDAEARTRLGLMLWFEDRRAEAMSLLREAVQLDPRFAEARLHLGIALRFSGRPADAHRELESAIQLDPVLPTAHQQLAFALASLGRIQDSLRAFEQALRIDPHDTTARDGLAELQQRLRQPTLPGRALPRNSSGAPAD